MANERERSDETRCACGHTEREHWHGGACCQESVQKLCLCNGFVAAPLPEPVPGEGCICAGNWRTLVAENEAMIGKRFADERGGVYTFFGIVHGDDDYYYGMNAPTGMRLLSCVGSIEGHGFREIERSPHEFDETKGKQ